MLADHHAGIEVLVEASTGSHAAFRSLDRNPVMREIATDAGVGQVKLTWTRDGDSHVAQGA
jgi:hypothetical protein